MKIISRLLFGFATLASIASYAQDSTPPQIEGVGSFDGSVIGICFNERLDPAVANDATHYSLNAGTISSATLQSDGKTVALVASGVGATFTVNVTGITDLSGNAVTGSASGRTVPNFVPQDLGAIEAPGVALSCGTNSFEVWARGLDIWGFADSGHYLSENRTGDFDVKVQVQALDAPGNDASAGLMVREDSNPGSRNVSIVVYPRQRNWTAVQRAETDGASTVLSGDWRIGWPSGINYPNAWLRIRRAGNTFTTYGSTNGSTWVQIGNSVTPANAYPDTVMVGLRTVPTEVTAPNTVAHASYRNYGTFAVTGATITITQQPTNTTAVENTVANFSVRAEATGTASQNLSYQWQKNGANIAGATARTYQTDRLARSDNNARYRVIISLPGGTQVTSQEAILTVQNDTAAPQIISTASLDGAAIGICFNEVLSESTANDPSHYTLTGATVSSATLRPDGLSVVLTASGVTGTNFSLSISGITDLAGNSLTVTTNGPVLGLTAQDVGTVAEPGSAYSCAIGAIDVRARGADIWGSADSGHIVWEPRTNDFDVRVQLQSFTAPAPDANAGLGVRESLDAGSRNVGIVVYANQKNWTSVQRAETDGTSSVLGGDWRIQWPEGVAYPNVWVRLKRTGNTFTTYGSTNGVNWIQIGNSVTPATPYPAVTYVGLRTTPVEVEVAGSTAVAEYRNYGTYVVTGAAISIKQQPTNMTVIENTSATLTVSAEATGTTANLEYQWQKNGVDIAGANSATYVTPALAKTDTGTKYRVIISLPGGVQATSQEATVTVTPDVVAPKILSAGAISGSIGIAFDEILDPSTANNAALYTITGATVDGATLLPGGRTVSLQVTGVSAGPVTVNIAGLKDLAGNALTGNVTAQNVGLTSIDLGTVEAPAVVASTESGSLDVVARGLDIWGTADSGHFAYEELTGDFDVKAQVAHVEAPAPDANVGLMARESLDAGSRNVSIVVYPNQKNWTAVQRAQTDGPSSVLGGDWRISWPGAATYPNVWVRLKRAGQTFTTYGSNDGQTWTQIGDPVTPATPYPATVYVGFRSTPVEVEVAGASIFVQYRNYGAVTANATPTLTITRTSATQITIAWPSAGAENFTLEASPTLVPANWAPVNVTPTTVGDSQQVNLPIGPGTRFFRLRR